MQCSYVEDAASVCMENAAANIVAAPCRRSLWAVATVWRFYQPSLSMDAQREDDV